MGFLVPTEWMTVEIHEITRSDDDHGVNDVTAVFAWDGEGVTLKQHPACRDRTVKTRIASLKIGDRIQVKGVMNVSHFIDPQARRAFRLTLIIDRIRDEGDVDERADESGDDSPDPEGNERRSRSSKRSRTSTFRTNRQRFRKDRVFAPHVLDRNSRRREDVHRDRGHAEEHGSNGDQVQETRQMWTGYSSLKPIKDEEEVQHRPLGNTPDVETAGSVPPTNNPPVVPEPAVQQVNCLGFDDENGQPGPPFNDEPLGCDDINWNKWYTHVCSDGTSRLILIRAEVVVLDGIDILCLHQTVKGPFGTGTVVRETVM
ncbi:hypothetical protein K457DRAFT_1823519 [Linnemannia elongata AG-77]|uniref:Uncharacterized protein n=1 Tax=Linnemannia elongata AG-77 TaxID=1314771 RepID=A0A197JIM6_9FUNG|nr:hypothetical protein K457DRAFT_1823519 [Linnemannia elongata AG-77]